MSKKDLEKESRSLLSKMILCLGFNVIAFLATGAYILTQQKRVKESGMKEVDPQFYAAQVESLKLMAIGGFFIALIPVAFCIYLVLKRTQVLKELKAYDNDLLANLGIK